MGNQKQTRPLSCNTLRAAKYLGFSEGYLRKLRLLDDGPTWIRIGSARIGYLYEDLDAWIKEQRVTPAGGI